VFKGAGIPITKQIPWLRVFVEGAVIVGSILLAFGIDAAWDGREQEQRRAALLAAIGSDMALAKAEVDRVATFHAIGQGAAADLLNFKGVAPPSEEQIALVDSLVAAAWGSTASYDAPLGAVESVVASGDLDLLSDPDLAFELTAFPAMVADLGWEQSILQAMSIDLHEFLGAQGIDTSLFDLTSFDIPWDSGPTESFGLVSSPRFRSIVSMLWFKYDNTTGTLNRMREAITRIESHLPAS
jgi:hypothetical protein